MKHSLTIRGHATSISVEPLFWLRLQAIARDRGVALAGLVAEIDAHRPPAANLSSAVRVFVLREALDRLTASDGSS